MQTFQIYFYMVISSFEKYILITVVVHIIITIFPFLFEQQGEMVGDFLLTAHTQDRSLVSVKMANGLAEWANYKAPFIIAMQLSIYRVVF